MRQPYCAAEAELIHVQSPLTALHNGFRPRARTGMRPLLHSAQPQWYLHPDEPSTSTHVQAMKFSFLFVNRRFHVCRGTGFRRQCAVCRLTRRRSSTKEVAARHKGMHKGRTRFPYARCTTAFRDSTPGQPSAVPTTTARGTKCSTAEQSSSRSVPYDGGKGSPSVVSPLEYGVVTAAPAVENTENSNPRNGQGAPAGEVSQVAEDSDDSDCIIVSAERKEPACVISAAPSAYTSTRGAPVTPALSVFSWKLASKCGHKLRPTFAAQSAHCW
jgi:hypothetical protein